MKTFDAAPTTFTAVPQPLRVLVVDDEPVSRDIVQKYLLADGHSVVTAASAQEGLERFRTDVFDLVVTDYAMAEMNGTQLAGSVKAVRPTQPILMLTGFSDPSLGRGEKPRDIDRLIAKPISQRELREALAGLCAAHCACPA